MFKNKKLWALIALVWAVMIIIPHEVPNYTDDTDFPWTYVPAAQGVQPDPYHGFVYPLVLKGAYFIWGDWILAGRVISATAMCLSIAVIFGLSGWTGVFLLILSPVFWHCGYHLTNDALGWLFFVGAYLFFEIHSGCTVARENREIDIPPSPIWQVVSGFLAGFAFCTRYQLGVIVLIGLFRLKKSWKFIIPAIILVGIQVFLNLNNGFGILGRNMIMNIAEKGTAFKLGLIAENLLNVPLRSMVEIWPLWAVLSVLSLSILVKMRRWELVTIAILSLIPVVLSFYSLRFTLPLLLPLIIGGSSWIGYLRFCSAWR